MRKFLWVYGAIALLMIVLKIFGLVSWWVATAPLWFPIGVALSDSLMMVLTSEMGNYWKRKMERKIIPNCSNCLYRKVQEMNDDEECHGEKMGAEKKDGKCPYYVKHVDGLEK